MRTGVGITAIVLSIIAGIGTVSSGAGSERDAKTYLLYGCGEIYYRPQQQGTTVVDVVSSVEPGANTNVEFDEY